MNNEFKFTIYCFLIARIQHKNHYLFIVDFCNSSFETFLILLYLIEFRKIKSMLIKNRMLFLSHCKINNQL